MKNISIFLVLILLLAACGEPTTGDSENGTSNLENDNSDEAVLEVYTTVYPIAYFTERIGGERVNVDSIYPPGANEYIFEPTQQDMISLADADLLFYIGLGLEGFINSAQKTLSGEKVQLIATADSISDEEIETEASHEEESNDDHGDDEADHEEEHEEESHKGHKGHDHGRSDPYVWLSPILSQKLAESIKESLLKADSEGAEMYEANYKKLVRELEQLDKSFTDLSNNVENKTFFVSHAAFGHIVETYGFEQVAIAGLNSQDEPSQKELTEIVNLAKEKNIDYVVFEQNVSSKLTEIVQKEIDAEAVQMHNLGRYPDTRRHR